MELNPVVRSKHGGQGRVSHGKTSHSATTAIQLLPIKTVDSQNMIVRSSRERERGQTAPVMHAPFDEPSAAARH